MIQKKVCMVGVFATGKTSLVRRFVEARFSDKYLSTVGVKIDRKPVRVGQDDVNLLLWDVEGRDAVADIQVSYLRGAAGLLYVVDGTRRETLEQIYELRTIVEQANGPLPSAVAINKSDLTDQWRVTAADESGLRALDWNVFTTSARSGVGVEEAFTWLATRMLEAK
jgi:small GTP-binding protein